MANNLVGRLIDLSYWIYRYCECLGRTAASGTIVGIGRNDCDRGDGGGRARVQCGKRRNVTASTGGKPDCCIIVGPGIGGCSSGVRGGESHSSCNISLA